MLKNRAVRVLLLLVCLIVLFIFSATRDRPTSSGAVAARTAPRAAPVPAGPPPCLDALTWVKAAASAPTTEWREVVDAVGINELAKSQLVVQVNSSWFAAPVGLRTKYVMDINELVEKHSKGCRPVFWDKKQNRVATVSASGVEILTN